MYFLDTVSVNSRRLLVLGYFAARFHFAAPWLASTHLNLLKLQCVVHTQYSKQKKMGRPCAVMLSSGVQQGAKGRAGPAFLVGGLSQEPSQHGRLCSRIPGLCSHLISTVSSSMRAKSFCSSAAASASCLALVLRSHKTLATIVAHVIVNMQISICHTTVPAN